ncbi:MAG TPA: serine hydrolase domain-containing protein [Fimbriimonadaceae bacterium]|nr:serine hydrolase domain-containing protein [Fimbriimonadaceae bacterium]HRJ32321.1 serine hydrolase domain-containing protein [Fimbriimonadaceae bacterium]
MVFTLLATIALGLSPTDGFSPATVNQVETSFASHMRARRARGGALLVTHGDGTISVPFGVKDIKGTPYTTATTNRIASVSKPITAVAVLTLVQAGKLRLDEPVLDVLNKDRKRPIVPKQAAMRSITARQLLCHAGGFGSDAFLFDQFNASAKFGLKMPISPRSLAELAFTTQVLASAPGAQFRYSNAGYLILGSVIEKVSGKPYEEFVRTAVLAPAGIKPDEAFIGSSRKLRDNETAYWDLVGRTGFSLYPEDARKRVALPDGAYALESMDAHGGWVMSADALTKFLRALPKLLGPEIQRQVTAAPPTAQSGSYYTGLGFTIIPESRGGFTILHGGDLEGCNAAIMLRADGTAIAVTCNSGGPPQDNGWSFSYMNQTLVPILNRAGN